MNTHYKVYIIREALFRIIYAALLAVVGWLVFLAIVGAWNIEIPDNIDAVYYSCTS